MGRSPRNPSEINGLKKGPWTREEDQLLIDYIHRHGHENWKSLPGKAGLWRCGKSCRLRWTNYLRPGIKRGNFSPEEEQKIIDLHSSHGNKWSMIASHLPRRTDNEIKNFWNTHLRKKLIRSGINPITHQPIIPCYSSFPGDPMVNNPLENLVMAALIQNILQIVYSSNNNPLAYFSGESGTVPDQFDRLSEGISLPTSLIQTPITNLENGQQPGNYQTNLETSRATPQVGSGAASNSIGVIGDEGYWFPGLVPEIYSGNEANNNDSVESHESYDYNNQSWVFENTGDWEAPEAMDEGDIGSFWRELFDESFRADHQG